MPKLVNITKSNNLLPFLHYFDNHGISWKKAAEQHHFPDDILEGDYWLPAHQVMSFVSTMTRTAKQNIGLTVGQLITIEQISPALAVEIQQCQSLEQAIQQLVEFMPRLSNHIVIWPEKIKGKWFLCHRGAYHPSMAGYDQAEWFRSFALLSLCRLFLGGKWQPNSVYMSFSSHLATSLPASFADTSFYYGQSFGALEIPLSDDFAPVVADKIEDNWFPSLQALINTYAILPWFNVDWLAHFSSSSARTLQRRFTQQGTHFRQLRDQARCDKAKQLLRVEKLSAYETAWLCGYTDLSNFNRAFKGWVGLTPSQYQKSAN